MANYEVGQTYKAFISGAMCTFEVLEEDDGVYGIRWDDDCEEWAHEQDLDRWTEAAKEKEMEEQYK
jgi:hypothetical protein